MPLQQLSREELFAEFDHEMCYSLKILLEDPLTEGVIIFENLNMDSSALGEKTGVVYGPTRTFKSIEDIEGKWINDLPSRRQYARRYYSKTATDPNVWPVAAIIREQLLWN